MLNGPKFDIYLEIVTPQDLISIVFAYVWQRHANLDSKCDHFGSADSIPSFISFMIWGHLQNQKIIHTENLFPLCNSTQSLVSNAYKVLEFLN